MRPIEPSSPVPLYFQIANVVQARIFGGTLHPGDPIGTEKELADEFGVSRITVRKALEILRTGDFKTLLRDPATGRALALKFRDEKSRPCYVLAFSPGEGLAPERRSSPAPALPPGRPWMRRRRRQ